MNLRKLSAAAAVFALSIYVALANARDLTFKERVKAQEEIERVYYSHQIGTTKPFEEAVQHDVIEKKVLTYLEQSVVLEELWHTSVTAEMLQREMNRQARQTRMPERLRELYAALGDDPFLVAECLARSRLVDRLTRSFHSADGRGSWDDWWRATSAEIDGALAAAVGTHTDSYVIPRVAESRPSSSDTWDGGTHGQVPAPTSGPRAHGPAACSLSGAVDPPGG
jgi:hypothetical protein